MVIIKVLRYKWVCSKVQLYADDLAVIANTENELTKSLNEWKVNNNNHLTAVFPGQPG